MTTPIYTENNYRKNLEMYWRQYFPNWSIPKGYHVHHIIPQSLGGTHHPKNLIALHPDDHKVIHIIRGEFNASHFNYSFHNIEKIKEIRLNDIDATGLNSYQSAAIKSAQTKSNSLNDAGLNIHQQTVIKSKQTCLTTIDENGLNLYQRNGIKQSKTKTLNIDSNGLNMHQRIGITASNIMKNDIDENGLNTYQRSITKKNGLSYLI